MKTDDIHQLRKTLRKNDHKYQTLFEKAGDAIFFLEADGAHAGRIIDANQCAAQMHGYTRKELMEKNIRDMDGPEDAQKATLRIQRMNQGEWIRTKVLHRKKDGTLFPVEISAGIIKIDDKPFILAFDRDITRQNKTRDALEEQLSFFQTLIDTIPSPIFYKDEKGLYLGCNTTFESYLGIQRKDLIGKSVHDIAPKDLADIYKAADEDLLRKKETQIYEASVKYADGKFHDVVFNKAVFSKKSGAVGGMVGVMLDITERNKFEAEKKDLQKKLYQAQKMEAIGNLSAGIAHDFNNILSGILGASQLLKLQSGNAPKIDREINKIISGTQRAAELVRQILTFSRQDEVQKVAVRVSAIVQEALKLIRASMPSSINIDLQILSKARVMADPGRIHQLVMNLCTNAYHAMAEKGGTLTLTIKEIRISEPESVPELNLLPTNYLLLEVADTGCGIPEKDIDRIFEPYFTRKKPETGTGLGLSVVHAIVKEHKGHIKVSSSQGQGSVFQIFFPVTDIAPSRRIKETLKTNDLFGTETIMIVDDEDYILSATQGLLEDYGYQTHCFSNGEDALKAFQEDPGQIDLVITDMTMPGMGGDELAQHLKNRRPELPIILCSGHQQINSKISADTQNTHLFLQKPIDLDELAQSIRSLLDQQGKR